MKQVITFIAIILPMYVFAQSALSTAETQFEMGAFDEAIKTYQVALAASPGNAAIQSKIAHSYACLNDYKRAAQWYDQVVKNDNVSPAELFEYGHILKSLKLYDKAKMYFEKYSLVDYELGNQMMASCDFATNGYKSATPLVVANPYYNTVHNDFAPAFFDQKLVFTSFRSDIAKSRKANFSKMMKGNTSEVFFVNPSSPSDVKLLLDDLQDHSSMGPISFSSNQKVVAITKNNFEEDQKFFQPERAQMSIYFADINADGSWDKLIPYAFNDNSYAMGFPWLSDDGNTMIFASNMPGGEGGYDLYLSRKEGSSWSFPENLGPSINTSGDEIAPFKTAKNLYFSSNQHIGYGGFDVFAIPNASDDATVTNLGLGINSPKDDYGFIYDNELDEGYISSDRTNSRGGLDIFKFQGQMSEVTLTVKDKFTKEPVINAEVTFTNSNTKLMTDENGVVQISIPRNTKEEAVVYSKGYFQLRMKLSNLSTSKHYMKYEVLIEKLTSAAEDLIVSESNSNENIETSIATTKDTYTSVTESKPVTPSKPIIESTPKKVYVKSIPVEKYAIQVSAFSKGSFDASQYRGLDGIGNVYDRFEKNMTKVRVGYFSDRASASAMVGEVRRMGYKDAFVVSEMVNSSAAFSSDTPTAGNATRSQYFEDNSDYKIRLATYSQSGMFNAGKVEHLGRLESYRKNNMTIMLLAGYASLSDAKLALKAAQMNGFEDAYVVQDNGGYLSKIED